MGHPMFSNRQRGSSPTLILFNVCVFAFVLLVGAKVIEPYIDYNTIRAVFEDVSRFPDSAEASPDALKSKIESALTLNNVRNWDLKENAYYADAKGNRVLGFDYEVRKKLFYNVDIVLSFKYEKAL